MSVRHSPLVSVRPHAVALLGLLLMLLAAPFAQHAAAAALGWSKFGPGSWPPGTWRPYAYTSPFNLHATGAAVAPRSAAIVKKILSWGTPGNLMTVGPDVTDDYGHPTYWAQPSDPLYTLSSTGYSPAINGMKIRIPSAARPAGSADAHMTVVEPDGWEYDFWAVASKPTGGGTMTFALGGRTRIDGSGLLSNATAARFGNLAGVIRAQEVASGELHHALFLVAHCATTATTFGYGTKVVSGKSAFVYPAAAGGSTCSSADNADAPPLGARLQLNMTDAQIAALNAPAWKKAILVAFAHYGGYIGDTGGPGLGLMLESSAMYTSLRYADPLAAFGQTSKLPLWNGRYVLDIASGIDWARYLRVLAPPTP
jgi:hypothetical protein